MRRPAAVWSLFGLCLLVGLTAMGWISAVALRAERAEAEARREAYREERVRLALWRMDSALSPLIAQENARPYFHYASFYPAERAYTRMFATIRPGEVLMASPLLTAEVPHVRLHFQSDPRSRLSSPQVPEGNMLDLAESAYVAGPRIDAARSRLRDLAGMLSPPTLFARLPAPAREPPMVATTALATPTPPGAPSPTPEPATQAPAQQQQALNVQEFSSRASAQIASNTALIVQQAPTLLTRPARAAPGPMPVVSAGALQPIWQGDTLFLVRRVVVDSRDYLQGCWLDWPALRIWLLGAVQDLLPEVELVPIRSSGEQEPGRMLAALPLRLIPGRPAGEVAAVASPVRLALGLGWAGAALAVLVGGVLLHQALALSERRAAFVSAVTHELRTPLTTFRMYAEMLAQGMVKDEKEKLSYLLTLQAEADRLDHLVRNVLAYARLESNRIHAAIEELTVAALLDRLGERLAQRAAQAGLALVVEAPDDVRAVRMRTDPRAVEQILFNLVDNACKYAAASAPATVRLRIASEEKGLLLSVRDHGPGIAPVQRRRLFKPFSKSAGEAAQSAPGVGLGLALSHRLARSLGGNLSLDAATNAGASFVLRLPRG